MKRAAMIISGGRVRLRQERYEGGGGGGVQYYQKDLVELANMDRAFHGLQ
jgi:hypothetical protein